MFEVRLETVMNDGKFNYAEHIYADKDSAIATIDNCVPDGFSCHGLNDTPYKYKYGHVIDLSTNIVVCRKERCYP